MINWVLEWPKYLWAFLLKGQITEGPFNSMIDFSFFQHTGSIKKSTNGNAKLYVSACFPKKVVYFKIQNTNSKYLNVFCEVLIATYVHEFWSFGIVS